jgi:hypothetical protein
MSTALFVLGAGAADRLTRMRPWLGAVVLADALSVFNLGPDDYAPSAGGDALAPAHAD